MKSTAAKWWSKIKINHDDSNSCNFRHLALCSKSQYLGEISQKRLSSAEDRNDQMIGPTEGRGANCRAFSWRGWPEFVWEWAWISAASESFQDFSVLSYSRGINHGIVLISSSKLLLRKNFEKARQADMSRSNLKPDWLENFALHDPSTMSVSFATEHEEAEVDVFLLIRFGLFYFSSKWLRRELSSCAFRLWLGLLWTKRIRCECLQHTCIQSLNAFI